MIINSIVLEEYGVKREIHFSDNNLIHSVTNSKGKTTLLRLLLYSIGYNIPETKYIRFEDCKIQTKITIDNGEVLSLYRYTRGNIVVKKEDSSEKTFILPSEENELHKIIFNADNIELLNNLLGVFYFDQEKGWTLLNRGVVIGHIRFKIEDLIRGIANIDCSELFRRKEAKKQDLLKYQQMFSLSKYQETIDKESNNLVDESYNTQIDNKINQSRMQQRILKNELSRIDVALSDNKHFTNYIVETGLIITSLSGEEITVTEENIVGLKDISDFLIAKKNIISSQYNHISENIRELEHERKKEELQLSFFDDEETIVQIFDKSITTIPINEVAVNNGIKRLEKEIRSINSVIEKETRSANSIITSIYKNTKKYLSELGVDDNSISDNFLFTSNLKELSGAILHKTVFALRLSCLLEVEKYLKIKIPIILDSPSGKEIDQENIDAMIRILNRDFSDNQVIIASIYDYRLTNMNKIELNDKLIE